MKVLYRNIMYGNQKSGGTVSPLARITNKPNLNNYIHFICLAAFIILLVFLLHLLIRKYTNYPQINSESFVSVKYPFKKCFVINLTNTPEGKRRWGVIKNHPQIKNFVTRFPAIHGKTYNYTNLLNDKEIADVWDYGKWNSGSSKMVKMSAGEIGCILSHYFIWKRIVAEKIPVTMILEDDAINIQDGFTSQISDEMRYLPQDWDIFLVGFWLHTGDIGSLVNTHIYKVREFALMHSYIISLRGAQKLLRLIPVNMPIDTWLSANSDRVNIYRHNLTINGYSKYPSSRLIRQKSRVSSILHTNNWTK